MEPATGFESDVPAVIRDSYAKYWWLLMFMWMVTGVGQAVGLNIFGSIAAFCMASIVHSMVKNRCEKMSQHCLLLFGFLNAMGALLDTVALITLLNGRVSQDVNLSGTSVSGATKSMTYKVTVSQHPFFDHSQGIVYNVQSAMLIASPVCNYLGSLLSYCCYHCYATSAFEPEDDLNQPMAFGGGVGGEGPNTYGGVEGPAPVQPFQGTGQRLGNGGPAQPFEGQGQRLGS